MIKCFTKEIVGMHYLPRSVAVLSIPTVALATVHLNVYPTNLNSTSIINLLVPLFALLFDQDNCYQCFVGNHFGCSNLSKLQVQMTNCYQIKHLISYCFLQVPHLSLDDLLKVFLFVG